MMMKNTTAIIVRNSGRSHRPTGLGPETEPGARPGRKNRRRARPALPPRWARPRWAGSFKVWNMKRKYHSGLIPAGADPEGIRLLPQLPGEECGQRRQQPEDQVPAHHVPQEEVRHEWHDGNLVSPPRLGRPGSARSCRASAPGTNGRPASPSSAAAKSPRAGHRSGPVCRR